MKTLGIWSYSAYLISNILLYFVVIGTWLPGKNKIEDIAWEKNFNFPLLSYCSERGLMRQICVFCFICISFNVFKSENLIFIILTLMGSLMLLSEYLQQSLGEVQSIIYILKTYFCSSVVRDASCTQRTSVCA